ncbi:MAG: helix-turn-helix domain-containing protein [Chloroflexi bacterium]|nr:helix-turn-helix domain-containing protein [Chloroflexota bacterium]
MVLQMTRRQILDILRRKGTATVEEMAMELDLAPMTVRQHLTVLERDALVRSQEVRRHSGRPHYLYSLTPLGEEVFPRSYRRLAHRILEEAKGLTREELAGRDGREMVALLFRKLAHRMVAGLADRFEGQGLADRVATVSRIASERGSISTYKKIEEGFEIRDYNCPYMRVAEAHSELCEWHLSFQKEALQYQEVERTHCQAKGDGFCLYVIHIPKGEALSS